MASSEEPGTLTALQLLAMSQLRSLRSDESSTWQFPFHVLRVTTTKIGPRAGLRVHRQGGSERELTGVDTCQPLFLPGAERERSSFRTGRPEILMLCAHVAGLGAEIYLFNLT
jgi:hypothetical protein